MSMKNKHYEYIGAFVPAIKLGEHTKELHRIELERPILFPHITFAYRPETVDECLFGERLSVRAIGYGCDGENEGLLVEVYAKSNALCSMIKQIPLPHITLSVSKTGEPINTRYLRFKEIVPFEFTAVFGGYLLDRNGPIFAPPNKKDLK